ncbi:MAG: hypothetical protein ATN35_03670 [Epulopiscium sp. Nele67-Bin004]|nr:MAG: hypothetical protein ATN35_03670 [Epulopiscium sp. Nele67-Bin004]
MIKIAVCDDDIKFTSQIEQYIYDIEQTNQVDIDVFFSGESLLKSLENAMYDIIYLDVEMGNINGIDTGHKVRELDKNVAIIYITNFISFAPNAFEVRAFGYLTKPIDKQKFEEYYKQIVLGLTKAPIYFWYEFKRQHFKVLISDIMFFESKGRSVYIKTANDNNKYYAKLNDVQNYLTQINVDFYRVSQSILINPKFVHSYKHDEMVLKNNESFAITPNRRAEVKQLFCKIKGDELLGTSI